VKPSGLFDGAVLLGTVALEPNRWGAISPDRAPAMTSADWLAGAEAAGFDAIELWENHAALASDDEIARIAASRLPVAIYSSYASFDEPDDAARDGVAGWVGRLGCEAVKFNVGGAADQTERYIERLGRFAAKLPPSVRAICECHQGTVAEDPAVAARILEAAGPADRMQALVHLGDDPETIDGLFDALGERIRHVHVNFLRQGSPVLADIADDVRARVARLRSRGFSGSYTIEFVNGVAGEADRPEKTLAAAVRDLALLREVLAE